MRKAAVLALDLATTTGWAWHRPGMPRPFFGAVRLPGAPRDLGQRLDHLERFLRDTALMNRPHGGISHFFFEHQHVGSVGKGQERRMINPETIKLLCALAGLVEKFAFQTGARVYSVSISEWRKYALGRGAGFKKLGLDPKQEAIAWAARMGWHTDVADAAEALGILEYGLSKIPNYPRPWRDNAFMGSAAE